MIVEDRTEEPEVKEMQQAIEEHRADFKERGIEHDPDCIAVKDKAGASVGYSKAYAANWGATFKN